MSGQHGFFPPNRAGRQLLSVLLLVTVTSVFVLAARLAASPMACTFTWKPFAAALATCAVRPSLLWKRSPVFPGSSLYGASSAAPRLPSAPSA